LSLTLELGKRERFSKGLRLSSESYRYQDIFYKILKALLSKQKMFIGGVLSTVCFILKPYFGFVQGRLIETGNCLEKNDRLMKITKIPSTKIQNRWNNGEIFNKYLKCFGYWDLGFGILILFVI
jgi:hypothetical protein